MIFHGTEVNAKGLQPVILSLHPTGVGIWHSLLDIVLVYVVLLLLGGSLLSVTLTWIITMVYSVCAYCVWEQAPEIR